MLCPVGALQLYLAQTSGPIAHKLFLNPVSNTPLIASTLSLWSYKSINYLMPDAICKGHDTRKLKFFFGLD